MKLGRLPPSLCYAGDSCGPQAAWLVLRHFGLRPRAGRLLRLSRWTPEGGAHAVGLAVALAEYGLEVELHTDPDPSPEPVELELYARAAALGVPVRAPAPLAALVAHAEAGRPAIVLYAREDVDDDAHFSVVIGAGRDAAGSPLVRLSDDTVRPATLERWRAAAGCYRQTVLALGRLRPSARRMA